ncbi:DNA repair protein RAD51 homolog 4-like [Artemia franciscana]|uniref:DNA repair protein RAD51 homolog 4-like n=1 Tax=Artemia franciscana TaxID=6661 RepID=UPI0032DA5C4B
MDIVEDEILQFVEDSVREKISTAGKIWHSLSHFLEVESEVAMKQIGLSYKEYQQIMRNIQKKNHVRGINAATHLVTNEKKFKRISSGFELLDNFLDTRGKGFLPGEIYEICGPPDSGKSTFCHFLTARISLFNKKNVLYIDTKGDFYGTTVMELLLKMTPDEVTAEHENEVVKCIKHRIRSITASSPESAVSVFHEIYKSAKEESKTNPEEKKWINDLGFIILDNITTLASFEISDKDIESGGQILRIGSMLRKLTDVLLVPIMIVNRNADIDAEAEVRLADTTQTNQPGTSTPDLSSIEIRNKLYFTEAGRIWDGLVDHRMDFRADRSSRSTCITLKKSAYRPCKSSCVVNLFD